MTRQVLRILRIDRTVADLARAAAFYTQALDFTAGPAHDVPQAEANLLGARHVRQMALRRGEQIVMLQMFDPPGAPAPADPLACDASFQHIALPQADIASAAARLAAFAPRMMGAGGPVTLPPSSGGVTALKFRDPDGHPLEYLQFPDGRSGGIDHSAIVVADTGRSIAFYRDELGFAVFSRQINTGIEQDRLDGLNNVRVEVAGLKPRFAPPHLELLGYITPPVRGAKLVRPNDLASTRLVIAISGQPAPELLRDPDAHALVLLPEADAPEADAQAW